MCLKEIPHCGFLRCVRFFSKSNFNSDHELWILKYFFLWTPIFPINRYRKVASSRLSWLVAHFHIFRLFMKGNFDDYVLWPLDKMVQNWIVDLSTARNFTVHIFFKPRKVWAKLCQFLHTVELSSTTEHCGKKIGDLGIICSTNHRFSFLLIK